MVGRLVILTGASGVGKTTILRAFQKAHPEIQTFEFDQIGVPELEVMVRDYGSGEAWQRAMTQRWLEQLDRETKPVLFEGSMRIVRPAQTILIDVPKEVRDRRLRERGQAHLINDNMDGWAAYLLEEARDQGVQILNGARPIAESVAAIRARF